MIEVYREDRSIYFQGKHHAYLLNVLKPLLRKGLQYVDKLPEPTKENTKHCIGNNNEVSLLIDLYYDFFRYENNEERKRELRGIWKLAIIMSGDLFYWERGQWVLRRIAQLAVQGQWKFGPPPRRPWWGSGEVCWICGQDKGSSKKVFADCPASMHV